MKKPTSNSKSPRQVGFVTYKPIDPPVPTPVSKAKKKLAVEKDPDGAQAKTKIPKGPNGKTK